MRTLRLAKLGLDRARRWLRSAEMALADKRYDDVVYSSQMSAEMAAKAVLLAFGCDYPKEHDVSGALLELRDREDVPGWFKDKVETLSSYVAILAEKRGLAGYGFEEGVDVGYFKGFAREAIQMARDVLAACEGLLGRLREIY